jgi:hypothetical protein
MFMFVGGQKHKYGVWWDTMNTNTVSRISIPQRADISDAVVSISVPMRSAKSLLEAEQRHMHCLLCLRRLIVMV